MDESQLFSLCAEQLATLIVLPQLTFQYMFQKLEKTWIKFLVLCDQISQQFRFKLRVKLKQTFILPCFGFVTTMCQIT